MQTPDSVSAQRVKFPTIQSALSRIAFLLFALMTPMAFAAILALVVLFTMTGPLAAQTTVFINEIHYDNAGTDTGEAIEVAGPAGTDLTGWSLVLYNGSNGSVYDTDLLNGLIPDSGNGYGFVVVSYPSNGIQNGSPDGIALVDSGNVATQFLSYEGSFTAVGGPADGTASVDIGVAESSSTPVGDSLQLTGSGTSYEDFSWAGAKPNTFGAANSGQTFGDAPPPSSLVINEIIQNPSAVSDTNGEWFEIYNTTASPIDIDGWTIEDNDFDSHLIDNGGPLFVPSEGYVVLGRNADSGANGGAVVDYQYSDFFLGNSADEVVLLNASLTEIDRVEWDGGPSVP